MRKPSAARRVIFATCEQRPQIAPDDQPLADALIAEGIRVDAIPWTAIEPGAPGEALPILLRSTWDYHRRPAQFGAWLRALEDSGRPVWNPAGIAAQNIDKIYLRDLQAHGIAIPHTLWIDSVDDASIGRILAERHWARAVLKPRVAATAYGTFLVDRDSALTDDDLAPARTTGALVQELVPEVAAHGELSAVYFDGHFSHAVLKRAAEGDFRVQQDFGGHVSAIVLAESQRAFADRVASLVPTGCLYARIDFVDTANGPLLMELELIEPELYFLFVPEAAVRLARAIAGRFTESDPRQRPGYQRRSDQGRS